MVLTWSQEEDSPLKYSLKLINAVFQSSEFELVWKLSKAKPGPNKVQKWPWYGQQLVHMVLHL